jgi:hypothetical protein
MTYIKGYKQTKEHTEKIRQKNIGLKRTEETKEKIRQKRKLQDMSFRKGQKLSWVGHSILHTSETKQKISEAVSAIHTKRWEAKPRTEFETFRRDVRRGVIKRPDRCEVCGRQTNNKTGMKNSICIDHVHSSGKVRGWLCNQCNRAVGMTYENPEILRKLAIYLEKKL